MRVRSINDLLDAVRSRPGMYLRGESLRELETLLHGYEACLTTHEIAESSKWPLYSSSAFADWLRRTKGWSLSAGVADAVHSSLNPGENALDRFFALLDEYRGTAT